VENIAIDILNVKAVAKKLIESLQRVRVMNAENKRGIMTECL